MLSVECVTPSGVLFSGEAKMVIAPTSHGEIGILTDHEPLLASLKKGVVRIKKDESGDPIKIDIIGGFISVDQNQIEIAVDITQ